METNIAKRNIESTFTAESQNFTIEASAKAFQILSSNLYTDKPMAIVRELSANALDAHMQAKEERPFSITLPNRMNPSFEIRDYGIGMSPETIRTLYTTFFGSDKNGDNDAIGGLGLGSKTPFSYTDTFTLLSFWQGVKYTWLCMIQEDGQPSISMVESEDTTEARGIQYIIPVKEGDFYTFSSKAKTVLKYFPKGSFEANDIEVTPVTYSLRRKEYGMRDSNNSNWPRVIMGPIAYRLDKSALDATIQSQYATLLNNTRLDIFCGIGDIDIQASREALSYDKKSQRQIIAVLKRVHDRITQDTTDEIASCPTYLDACIKGLDLAQQANASFKDLTWKGTALQRDFDFDREQGVTIVSGDSSLTKSDALSLSFSKYGSCPAKVAKAAVIVYYDSTVQFNKIRLKTLLLKDRVQKYICFNDEQEMLAFQSLTQRLDNISTADMPMPEKEDRTYTSVTRSKVQLKYRSGKSRGWKNLTQSIEEINALEDTCWVPLSGGGNEPWEKPEDKLAFDLATRFTELQVVGIPKSLKRKVKFITLPTIQDMVLNKVFEYIGSEERFDAAFVVRSNIKWLGTFQSHVDKKKWKDLELVKYANLWESTQTLQRMAGALETLYGWKLSSATKTLNEIKVLDAAMTDGYELLQVVDSMYGYNSMSKHDYTEKLLTLIHRSK